MDKRSIAIAGVETFSDIKCSGYVALADSPEVVAGVDKIANLIASMTIYLMRNGDDGDVRVKNELSRKIDINPCKYITRYQLMQWIVRTLYLYGKGNAVVYPRTEQGYLRELVPCPNALVFFTPKPDGYEIMIDGRNYQPDEVLHFRLNPDNYYTWRGRGVKVLLKDVANNLKQAQETEASFMSSNWKPSLIVKIDALVDELASPESRQKFVDQYLETSQAGQPWLIPADQLEVEQVRPLSLSDLALADFVELDKKTVASILGVPPFVLGVGNYSKDEWNNFINSTVMPLALSIQQEMTKKLLLDPSLYFKFNSRSLYAYDLTELANVADEQYIRGLMTGNEVRGWLGLDPLEGLNELVILENYIPLNSIADQNKLGGTE